MTVALAPTGIIEINLIPEGASQIQAACSASACCAPIPPAWYGSRIPGIGS